MDNNHEIKQANRRALPKFLLIVVVSLLVGGAIGFCAAKYGLNRLADGLTIAGAWFGTHLAPWLMLAVAMILPVVCVPLYRSAKKLLATWDGDAEELADAIEKQSDTRLSLVVWLTSAAMILSYFLIAAAYSGGMETFAGEGSVVLFFAGIVGFFAIMIEAIILQQKCVDAAKQTNPEKTASVYDTRFHRKWLDSCDEAEKLMIGKCAFRAYSATNSVCSALAVVLALAALIFGTGFLPSLVVCVIWIVNLSVYCREALKYSRAGKKIS